MIFLNVAHGPEKHVSFPRVRATVALRGRQRGVDYKETDDRCIWMLPRSQEPVSCFGARDLAPAASWEISCQGVKLCVQSRATACDTCKIQLIGQSCWSSSEMEYRNNHTRIKVVHFPYQRGNDHPTRLIGGLQSWSIRPDKAILFCIPDGNEW